MNADFSFELPGNQVLITGRCLSLMALRSGRAYDLQAWPAAATSSPRGVEAVHTCWVDRPYRSVARASVPDE